ncbi:MAG: hypothetical protein WBM38_06750, partial [Arenicellales bacterium]
IPQAHAGDNFDPYVCVTPNSAGTQATVQLLIDGGQSPELYTFTDVPLNVKTCDHERSFPCSEPVGVLFKVLACCTLKSITGTGVGRLDIGDRIVEFSVGPNTCDMPDVCGPELCPECVIGD